MRGENIGRDCVGETLDSWNGNIWEIGPNSRSKTWVQIRLEGWIVHTSMPKCFGFKVFNLTYIWVTRFWYIWTLIDSKIKNIFQTSSFKGIFEFIAK